MANKKKLLTSVAAVGTAAAILLGGTFAWQSINQTALNEASDVINPGGRLHDDFDGSNKDVYVENFADEDIFARIQLSEYFAIIANYGKDGAETKTDIVGSATLADGKITDPTYAIHYFDQANATDEYWNWTTGGSTVFMPTFNLNKDSLVADINGTYVDAIGGISNRDGNQYTDYTEYAVDDAETGTEIYDGDTNMADEVKDDFDNLDTYEGAGNIVTVPDQEHAAKETGNGELISMAGWLALIEENGGEYDATLHGNYWVYDTDGWVYWSAPIAGRNEDGTTNATGLLLDGIELNGVMDDTWYYAINVVAQFVTADDVGKSDNTGFYVDNDLDGTPDSAPTTEAEALLKAIGVDMDGEAGSNEPEEVVEYKIAVKADEPEEDGYVDPTATNSSLYNGDTVELVLNYGDTAITEGVTWKMELIDGGSNTNNNTLQDGTAIGENTGVLTIASNETTYQSGSYTSETYHIIKVTASVDGTETASRKFVISASGVSISGLYFYEVGTSNRVEEPVAGTTYDVRASLYNQSLWQDGENITNGMEPIYVDGLNFTITGDEGNSATNVVLENGQFTAAVAGAYTINGEGTLENWGEVSIYDYVTVVEASSTVEAPVITLTPATGDGDVITLSTDATTTVTPGSYSLAAGDDTTIDSATIANGSEESNLTKAETGGFYSVTLMEGTLPTIKVISNGTTYSYALSVEAETLPVIKLTTTGDSLTLAAGASATIEAEDGVNILSTSVVQPSDGISQEITATVNGNETTINGTWDSSASTGSSTATFMAADGSFKIVLSTKAGEPAAYTFTGLTLTDGNVVVLTLTYNSATYFCTVTIGETA